MRTRTLWGYCEACHCQQLAVCQDCKIILRALQKDTLTAALAQKETSDSIARLTAQFAAHRAIGNQEQDTANGKLAGYCAVCQVVWPCEFARTASAKDLVDLVVDAYSVLAPEQQQEFREVCDLTFI